MTSGLCPGGKLELSFTQMELLTVSSLTAMEIFALVSYLKSVEPGGPLGAVREVQTVTSLSVFRSHKTNGTGQRTAAPRQRQELINRAARRDSGGDAGSL